jgi:competence protein ComEA
MEAHMTRFLATSCALLMYALCNAWSALALAGPVNINTADASTLSRELKGIGAKRAEAIVEYRRKFGPFKSADELALVKGIGPSAIEKNREFIRLDVKPGAKPAAESKAATPAKR